MSCWTSVEPLVAAAESFAASSAVSALASVSSACDPLEAGCISSTAVLLSLVVLSRACLLASGRSLGPAGEEGSSSGLLVEATAEVGEADMVLNGKGGGFGLESYLYWIRTLRTLSEIMYTEVVLCGIGRECVSR